MKIMAGALIILSLCIILIGVAGLRQSAHQEQSAISRISEDYSQYEVGFNHGVECMSLLALELRLTEERKTYGEMEDICRDRYLKED